MMCPAFHDNVGSACGHISPRLHHPLALVTCFPPRYSVTCQQINIYPGYTFNTGLCLPHPHTLSTLTCLLFVLAETKKRSRPLLLRHNGYPRDQIQRWNESFASTCLIPGSGAGDPQHASEESEVAKTCGAEYAACGAGHKTQDAASEPCAARGTQAAALFAPSCSPRTNSMSTWASTWIGWKTVSSSHLKTSRRNTLPAPKRSPFTLAYASSLRLFSSTTNSDTARTTLPACSIFKSPLTRHTYQIETSMKFLKNNMSRIANEIR